MKVHRAMRTSAAAAVAAALLAAGCGSSSDSSSTSSTPSGASGASGSSGKADQAAAKQNLAPYTGKPSAFPVDTPLPKPLPAGTKLGFLQCVTPVCGIFASALEPAAKTLGAELDIVKAGASADE